VALKLFDKKCRERIVIVELAKVAVHMIWNSGPTIDLERVTKG